MRGALIATVLFGSMMVASVSEAGHCPKAKKVALTRAEAEQVALKHVGGGEVIGSERDCERGRDVYEVEIHGKDGLIYEVSIAVDDGSIVDVDIDD